MGSSWSHRVFGGLSQAGLSGILWAQPLGFFLGLYGSCSLYGSAVFLPCAEDNITKSVLGFPRSWLT